jgi:hypothetical protein
MNLIDQYLIELEARDMKASLQLNGQWHVLIGLGDGDSVESFSGTLESAVRDALENARLGLTVHRFIPDMERIYTAFIDQTEVTSEGDERRVARFKRFIADNDSDAYEKALRAFSDRVGFEKLVDVTLYRIRNNRHDYPHDQQHGLSQKDMTRSA